MMSGSEVWPVQTPPKTEMYPGSHFDVNERVDSAVIL